MFPNEKIVELVKALKAQDHRKADGLIQELIKTSDSRGAYHVSKRLREVYALPYANIESNGASISGLNKNENVDQLYEIRMPSVNKRNIILSKKNRDIIEEILQSYKNKDKLAANNIPVESRLLLHGPPGTGKTLLAYVIAGELGVPVMHVNIDMLISSYLGETGRNISKIFEEAARNNYLVLLDEFDAIAKNRDDDLEVGELKRVVTVLLQNLDALNSDVMIVAATNHDHLLDKAIRRRFAYEISMEHLDLQAREALLRLFLREVKQRIDYELLATLTSGQSGAYMKLMVNKSLRRWIFANKQIKLMDVLIEEALRSFYGASKIDTRNPVDAGRLSRAIHRLRDFNAKLYTFNHLEDITSVPKSTLNDLVKNEMAR